MTPRSLSHRAPLGWLVAAWAVGATLAHAGFAPGGKTGAALLAGLAFLGLVVAWLPARSPRRSAWYLLAGSCLALAAAGALRTGQIRARLADWDAFGLPPREARLELRLERAFTSREDARNQASGIARVLNAPPPLAELRGQRIQFSTTWPPGAPAPLRGAEFTTRGVLSPLPFSPPPGSFDRFIADEGVNFSLLRARMEGTPQPAGPWARFCAAAGNQLEKILRTGLAGNPGPANLYVAMMLGQKQELSLEQKDWFVRSGTMHLFAISGLHIAGIAAALNTLLLLVRLPARHRFILGTAILWTYVEITGGAPSAVRAFWMVTCVLGARELRLPGNGLAGLAVAALGALVISPHQLFSAGFQMSYGIVLALLLYGVPLQDRWHEVWQPWARLPAALRQGWRAKIEKTGRAILGAVALGLAAALISTPATLVFFGLLTPGSFFVNLLLIPASTLVLFAGVAALVVGGLGLAPLASLFNHAAALVLTGMEWSIGAALTVPGVSWPAQFIVPWLAPVAGLGMLAVLAAGYASGWPRRLGGYWTPQILLILLVLFGVRAAPPPIDAGTQTSATALARPSGP